MPLVIGFEDADATDLRKVGGKASSLGRLVNHGFPVPPGFSVSTEAHDRFLATRDLATRIHARVAALDFDDAPALERRTAEIRAEIAATPLPPEIAEAVGNAYRALGEDAYVAVRSSGTAEDLEQASFAGMYDTYLDVRGLPDLLDAVRRCWASMWTARVSAYRHQLGFDGEAERLAVVIQCMLEPDAAGVMFTANPLTARTDEIVLNASWGLGEAVVSGAVNPDTYVLDRNTLVLKSFTCGGKERRITRDRTAGRGTREDLTPDHARGTPSLSETEARQLAGIGREIMARYDGLPQDIEWARCDDRFHILQARPVTGVEFTWDEDVDGWQTAPDDPDTTWTYTWSEMYWTGGISPLFYSCRAYECFLNYARFARLFGFRNITNVRWHRYRRATAYFSADAERSWLIQQWPGALRDVTNIPPAWQPEFTAVPVSWWGLARMWLRVHVLAPRFGVTRWFATTYDYLDNRTAEADGPTPEQLQAMDLETLIATAETRIAFVDEWYTTLWPPFFFYATGALGALAKILEHWVGDDGPRHFQDLIAGIPGNQAALEGEALFELAERIRSDATLRTLFEAHPGAAFFEAVRAGTAPSVQAFAAAYAEFLHAHGHRGHQDRDFYYDRRIENPALDYDALRQLLNTENPVHPALLMARLVRRREEITAEIAARLRRRAFGALREKVFRFVADYCVRFLKYRDDERHYLDRLTYGKKKVFLEIGRRMRSEGLIEEPDDFWFLARHELYDYLRGYAPVALCKAKMEARKRVFHRRNARLEPTPTWIRHDLPVDLSLTPAGVEDLPEGTLVGIATSHGIATGVARIVPQLNQIGRVQNGDILVCNSTDPGWMSVFPKIRGLVLETGGMLAHGACLSREYGIPAVQVRDAMRQIPDAVPVTVDGNAARVYPAATA
ncbi:MAG: PEP/pyruvate-binding domain-containing protein [Gammaproteobacteria bacterium]